MKKYIIDDTIYYFNHFLFNKLFISLKKEKYISINQIEEEMSSKICVSQSAIHNWRNNNYSPNDLDTIKQIADFFNIKDYLVFLKERNDKNMNKLSDLKLSSVKRIYDSLIDYLEYFEKTNGFNDIWFDLTCDPKYRQGELCDIALKEVDKVISVYKKEWVLLKDEDIYTELENLIFNDLYETFDNKLSYGYRFEADSENGSITTFEEISNFTNKLQSIINKYC